MRYCTTFGIYIVVASLYDGVALSLASLLAVVVVFVTYSIDIFQRRQFMMMVISCLYNRNRMLRRKIDRRFDVGKTIIKS